MFRSIYVLLAASMMLMLIAGCGNPSSGQGPIIPESGGEVTRQQPAPASPELTDTPDRESQIIWNPAFEYEPNDTTLNATQIWGYFNKIDGHIDKAADLNDYYRIYLYNPGCIYVNLEWTNPGSILNLYLYDAASNPIDYDSEAHGSPKHAWGWQLAAGNYYVRVKASHNASDYRIKFAFSINDHEPPNNTIETITGEQYVNYGETWVSCAEQSADQNDYYRIDIDEKLHDGFINFKLDWAGIPGTNYHIYLYRADYTPIEYSNGNAQPEAFTVGNPPIGTFYVRVKCAIGGGVYELSIKPQLYLILDPQIFYLYEIPKWPWPDPGPWWDKIQKFDPTTIGNPGFNMPIQWNWINPQPEPPGGNGFIPGEMPQNRFFGY